MILRRILATTASSLFVVGALASCGGGTGEAPTNNTNAQASTPAQPAASAAPAKATYLILQGDTVRGTTNLTDEEKTYLSCVQESRFPQNARIVWRYHVIDPTTGKQLDDKALKSFDLTLADGSTVKFNYGGHGGTKPNYAEYFWTAGWTVPADYPTGLFNYQVKAVSLDGAIGTFDQFKVPSSQLTIVKAGTR